VGVLGVRGGCRCHAVGLGWCSIYLCLHGGCGSGLQQGGVGRAWVCPWFSLGRRVLFFHLFLPTLNVDLAVIVHGRWWHGADGR
jgi:hypothetical protein